MNTTLEKISIDLDSQIIGKPQGLIDNIAIDSRSLQLNSNTLFVALKGKHGDGHDFIPELLKKGVCNFLVSVLPDDRQGNYILVPDTLRALQQIAKTHRKMFDLPVIGITGSNGKTIVKEWLNFLLMPDYNIVRSPKSYNSQIGVPLSVLAIASQHNLGIFEAGISEPEEMQYLEPIISPAIGILTNIGEAHNEGFYNKIQKVGEKVKLFKHAKIIIYQKAEIIEKALEGIPAQRFPWSFSEEQNCLYIQKKILGQKTLLSFNFRGQDFRVTVPFTDYASLENAVHAMMVMLYLGYDKKEVSQRMELLYPIEMRLRVKNGINNTTLIDDSYISDLQSLKIALDFMEQQKQHLYKKVILSDILESGESPQELYSKVAMLLEQNQISEVIGIGDNISHYASVFKNIRTYQNTIEFLKNFDSSEYANQTILVKGARNFHLEEIVTRLEEKTHQTVLEINLNAITHNLNFFKNKLLPKTKLMVMIKAFGYGSGSFEIARLLEYHKVDYLGVAFTDEGIQLRNTNIKLPIIVMNPEPGSFRVMIAHRLEPEIYSLKELELFKNTLLKSGENHYPIHLKIDSGMHRLGFEEKDIEKLIVYLKDNETLFEVKSVFSHFSGSDSEFFTDFTHQQFQTFSRCLNKIKTALQSNPIGHIANTSAISRYPDYQLDMVRLGIGLYGISNDLEEIRQLETVGTLKTVILQIKDIQQGDSVGYSRGFRAETPIRSATLPIGYADGIPRALSKGKGYVLINGKKAPIIGLICMDMMMVDVTDIACQEGDTAIIFGDVPKVTELAQAIDTIPYELLAGISHRVKRIFYRE